MRSWMIETLIPVSLKFYREMEVTLNASLIEPIKLLRNIPSDDYEVLWNRRLKEPENREYMCEIENHFGEVKHGFILDCSLLMELSRRRFEKKNILVDDAFSYDHISVTERGVAYRDQQYDHVVFCEGPYASKNPFFEWLPWNICKGEWIIIETESPITDVVVNRVINIIPLGKNRYKLSSTFEWEELDWKSSKVGEKELTDVFSSLFDTPYKIIEHVGALRPTVADRRPYLGTHPKHKHVHIFNGLGTKGVMLAPFFSKHFIEYLIDNSPILADANIVRHRKRYLTHIEKKAPI